MSSVGVVVLHDDDSVVGQIVEALEELPDVFTAGTSLDSVRAGHVVLAGGEPLLSLPVQTAPLIALMLGGGIEEVRAALTARARDIVRWPQDAGRLAGSVQGAARAESDAPPGRVVAVAGARGGVGATVVAACLAEALGDAIVLDVASGDGQRGFCADEPGRTLHDLAEAGLLDAPGALAAALVSHGRGARALLGRSLAGDLGAAHARAALRSARSLARWVVIDTGTGHGDGARAALLGADVRVLAVANDIASVRAGVGLMERGAGWILAVRRVRRSGVPIRDVVAALGSPPHVVLPQDGTLARAVDFGRLPARRSRTVRATGRLAALIQGDVDAR